MPLYIPAGVVPAGSISASELAADAATQAELDAHAALTPADTIHGMSKKAAYTQTYSATTRTHGASALETVSATLATALIADPGALLSSINTAVNEVKGLTNSLIDDAQANSLAA